MLFLIAISAFAQDEPMPLGQSLPRDPAFLTRMREQLTFELRETQRQQSIINPNDFQLAEIIRTRQAELARQINDVTSLLQTLGSPGSGETLPGTGTLNGFPPSVQQGTPSVQHGLPSRQPVEPGMPPVIPMPGNQNFNNSMPVLPVPGGTYYPPTYGNVPPFEPMMPVPPSWGGPQAQAFDAAPWGPRLPKELAEVKQSVDSLQREIVELKELVRRLETQIQLLNRTVLLLSGERMTERVPAPERARENEE